MRAPAAIAAVLLPLALAACGDESSAPSPAAAPGWSAQRLAGATSVDHPTLMVTEGDDALVLMLSDEGVLRSHLSSDGGEFVAGEPLEIGERYAALGDVVRLEDGTWLALGSGGLEKVDGDERHTYAPFALRSADGSTWERTDVTGFTDAVEIHDLEVVDGRVVAVGAYRTLADASGGGLEARAWTSTDGRSFSEVRLPDVPDYRGWDDESYAGAVVGVGGDLLASGRIGGQAALWRSSDAGSTWSRVESPALRGAHSFSGLRADGSTVVATVSADVQAIRSEDGGVTWQRVDALPLNEEADGWAPLWGGARQFFTLTGIDDQSWSAAEVCYADLDQCGYERQPEPRVVASADGAAWNAVKLPVEEVDEIAGTADGRLLVMAIERGGVVVHTWPPGADLPVADDPAQPETVELVTLGDDETPEIGVRYHAPMYVHCGMDWLWFGDGTWRRTDDGPDVETGAGDGAPAGWPLVGQRQTLYGYATVLADGTLEYSTEDGTVIATYERRDGAPGCA